MIDGIHIPDPPQLEQPQHIKNVRSRRRSARTRAATPWVIGAIILLDGQTPCQIVALYPEPLCVPVQP